MRTSKLSFGLVLTVLFVVGTFSSLSAQTNLADVDLNAANAFRTGTMAYRSGDKVTAVGELEKAAKSGHPLAQWKLGRMFSLGDGVQRDDLKAFFYFQQVADRNADANPRSRKSPLIANAFVSLARYHLSGIPNSKIGRNVDRAKELLIHAATYFGDPTAQFELGKVYLKLRKSNTARAVRWLLLAAHKGHTKAQCEVGKLLLKGGDGFAPRPDDGLMWLEISARRGDGKFDHDACPAHKRAFKSAESRHTNRAKDRADRWISGQEFGVIPE